MPRDDLFDLIEPYDQGWLPVSDLHQIYYEQSGRRDGVPVLVIHGGPGSGSSLMHRRFFDPKYYRIILYDQRGAGQSKPSGELQDNTIPHLIEDIEKLRAHLGIESWHVFGGSWGSTLALAYAQYYPAAALSLCLRGVFLMRQSENDWIVNGMRTIFPEAWQAFAEFLPEDERSDLLLSYHKRLTDPDPAIHYPAAHVWNHYENSCARLLPDPASLAIGEDTVALARARIENYFMLRERFAPEDALLRNIDIIRHIPAAIVQGRYDIVCPIVTADELHSAWPEADYIIVPDAGHSANEFGIRRALIRVTEQFKSIDKRNYTYV